MTQSSSWPAAPLQKSTQAFSTDSKTPPLEFDVYDASDYPNDAPVFLFFHSGGLVTGARIAVHPWLVQACYQRTWPLVSASYRLLPQAGAEGLLEDAGTAYEFARNLGDGNRLVIVGGASAGFFLATLVAHNVSPKPIALLSITGIPTFRHKFFNSSVLLAPDPITEEEIERYISEPASVGKSVDPEDVFYLDRLLPNGAKNPDFRVPSRVTIPGFNGEQGRGILYDYHLHENMFEPLLNDVDPGLEWPKDENMREKLGDWPVTIFIQGDEDVPVDKAVSSDTADALGPERAIYIEAKGQGHLFMRYKYLEDSIRDPDGKDAMDTVRRALEELDRVVDRAVLRLRNIS